MTGTEIPAGYLQDEKGRLWPVDQVKPALKLEDDVVVKIIEYARKLSAEISRFKGHTFDDVASFMDLLSEEYGTGKGGKKGNVSLKTFDGRFKVQVAVQDYLDFGPELRVAKQLIDACIRDWSEDSNANIQALVNTAFSVDKPGQVNRESLFALRKVEIDDERWKKAMQAITDSVRISGSKTYIRLYDRDPANGGKYKMISIDLASAEIPPAEEDESDEQTQA